VARSSIRSLSAGNPPALVKTSMLMRINHCGILARPLPRPKMRDLVRPRVFPEVRSGFNSGPVERSDAEVGQHFGDDVKTRSRADDDVTDLPAALDLKHTSL
jgi:hypothetical protein